MQESDPDYENPSVVRINSIALGLVLCFLSTLVLMWFVGRGAQAPVEPTPDDPPTPDVDPTVVVISTPSTLDIRLALRQADADRGAVLYQNYGCANCHSLDQTNNTNGPSLDDVERRVPQTYDLPENYLIDVILDPPGREVRGGYTNLMPSNYDELLSAQDIADIVWFVLSQ